VRWLQRIPFWLPALALVLLLAEEALARVGGGQSYSGGGSGGGGGGGGGGGDAQLVFFLIRLVFYYPQVGVPVAIGVVIWVVVAARKRGGVERWDSGSGGHTPAAPVRRPTPDLERVRTLDPDFSSVVFEDFASRLFATAHQARTDARALDALAPYLNDAARGALSAREPRGESVSNVVVGAMRPIGVELPGPRESGHVRVVLEYEANLTTSGPRGRSTFYSVERWSFARAADARTRPPQAVSSFGCPSCGAPFESADNARCNYCNQVVAGGRFDWQATGIQLVVSERRPPALTGTVAEQGTDAPTVIQRGFDGRWAAFSGEDPAVTWDAIDARLRLVYDELNAAWVARDLRPVRGFVSEGMADYLQYWVDAYIAQGLENRLDDMAIERWTPVKLVRDRWFDALTLRMWASGRDYTLEASSGKVVGGSKSRKRKYSEYWTFIRSSQARGAPRADTNCPNCGSRLDIGMAGNCKHCGAHITSGEFDWVLSRIDQDESYLG
jgi:hypothetical protein